MRRFTSALFLLSIWALFSGPVLTAEVSLYGEALINISAFPAFPYAESRFDGPLNPGNYQGLHDLNLGTDLLLKLSGQEETAGFDFWLAVKPYQLGQVLLAASLDDPAQTAAVVDSLALLGSRIDVIDILRANIAWYVSDFLILKIGRQGLLTGYGYGWNPIDFFNPLKDPFNPNQELKGVDALSVQYYLGNLFTLKLAGIYRPGGIAPGVDYPDLQVGAEMTGSFPSIELKLTGFYDYDESLGEDAYVPAVGAGLKADIAGIGIYGEAALKWGSRAFFPSESATLSRKEDLLFSGLAGAEYTFAWGLSAIVEYFYNGEGYSLADRKLYQDNLAAAVPYPPSDLALMYRPGYFAGHYIGLYLYLPLYDLYTDIGLSLIYSPDSWSLNIFPSITLNVTGSLAVGFSYLGLISLDDEQYNEAWFSPLKHIFQLEASYSF